MEATLASMPEDKAPGVDGFPLGLIKRMWTTIKKDVMAVFQEFHNSGTFDWRLNTTLIALIPKKLDASWVSDYRPISLVSSIYKILSKVLADRLKECLPELISPNQSTFIKERQILDGVFGG